MSFKEYVEQNYAHMNYKKNLSSLGMPKDSIHDSIEGSVSSRVQGRQKIEARHSSLNNTLVPKLQALKPKKLIETNQSTFSEEQAGIII